MPSTASRCIAAHELLRVQHVLHGRCARAARREARRERAVGGRARPGSSRRSSRPSCWSPRRASARRCCRGRRKPSSMRPRASSPAATGSRRSTDLMRRIHRDFEFEPGATTTSTSVETVLANAQGRLPGFRPPDDLLPALARAAGLVHLGLPAHQSAARQAAAGGRRRLACLGRAPGRPAMAGWSSIRPTTPWPTSASWCWAGEATSPTWRRCEA